MKYKHKTSTFSDLWNFTTYFQKFTLSAAYYEHNFLIKNRKDASSEPICYFFNAVSLSLSILLFRHVPPINELTNLV